MSTNSHTHALKFSGNPSQNHEGYDNNKGMEWIDMEWDVRQACTSVINQVSTNFLTYSANTVSYHPGEIINFSAPLLKPKWNRQVCPGCAISPSTSSNKLTCKCMWEYCADLWMLSYCNLQIYSEQHKTLSWGSETAHTSIYLFICLFLFFKFIKEKRAFWAVNRRCEVVNYTIISNKQL